MKLKTSLRHILLVVFIIILAGCIKDPEPFPSDDIHGEINSIRIDPDATSYFQSFRSAPEMGSVNKLFYGNYEGYSDIYSLLEFYSVESSFFLDTLYSVDSSRYSWMYVDHVDLFLSLYNAADTLTPPFVYYYSTDGDTNFFSQSESSYFTVDPSLSVTETGEIGVESDTLGNASFKIDVTNIFNEFILDSLRLNSNTFKIVSSIDQDSVVGFYPSKMEVSYYRTTEDINLDSTWIDTLTTAFATKQKLTVVNPLDWEETGGRFTIGRAKGVKSILSFNLDTLLTLSNSTVIKDADLILQSDQNQQLIPGFKVLAYPLADSVDFDVYNIEVMDTTKLEFLGAQTTVQDSTDHYLTFKMRNFASYLQMGHLNRYQLQLSSSAENNPFIIYSFINDGSFHPYLKVRYVVTD